LIEIVGVAKDALYHTLYDAPHPYLFLPQFQQYSSEMTLLVSANVAGDLKAVAENVRREVGRLDSRVPIFGVKMAEENLSYAYWGPRLAAGMGTAFGLLALLLAAMGLYSVMTYTMEQRTREIGIRMALGAQIQDVLKLIVSQGMKLVLMGVVIGFAGAFAVTRVASSFLFGVSATDPVTFVCVAILLFAVALLACWIPARRATRVDPLGALRHD
jgi:ABC-type antimicrobial peptide transport system permease subunit